MALSPPAPIDFDALEAERRREEQSRFAPAPRTSSAVPPSVRTLPHSVECEEALLSCCLIEEDEGSVLRQCVEHHVEPSWFYVSAHGTTMRER